MIYTRAAQQATGAGIFCSAIFLTTVSAGPGEVRRPNPANVCFFSADPYRVVGIGATHPVGGYHGPVA